MRPPSTDCLGLPVFMKDSSEELDARLRDVDGYISRNPSCVLSHTTRSRIHTEFASRFDDDLFSHQSKLQHLEKAANSANTATLLAPMSPCLALLSATALFQTAQHTAAPLEYKAVIKECLRGLLISIPKEPVEGAELALEIDIARLQLSSLAEASADKILFLATSNRENMKSELVVLERKKKEIFDGFLAKRHPRALKNVLPHDVDVMARVRTYWENTMSHEKRMEFSTIGIQELEAHFDKNNLKTEKQVLKEAKEFAKEMKKWKFWVCCCCGARSGDDKSNLEHITRDHLGALSEYVRALVPQRLPGEVVQMVESGDWGPVDSCTAAKIMGNLMLCPTYIVPQLFCEDKKRIELLNRIRSWLQMSMGTECFAPRHLTTLQNFITRTLQKRFKTSTPMEKLLNWPFQSICLLEFSELEIVLRWLTNVGSVCALPCLSEKYLKSACVEERTDFCSSLLLERFLRGDIDVTADDDITERTSSVEEVDTDAFVHWLCKEGPAIEDHLKTWTNLKETAKSSGMKFLEILRTELQRLQRLCREKDEILPNQEAIQKVDRICVEEIEKREENPGYVPQSFDNLLFSRKTEILDQEVADSTSNRTRAEAYTICSILGEADTDTEIKLAIQKHKNNLSSELNKLDALILATMAAMRSTEQKLGIVSAFDYGLILFPLLKSFLQARILKLIDKDHAVESFCPAENGGNAANP